MESNVTIVIPVYNREHLVGRTLDSVAAQTVQCPVVLVDNGSADGSRDVLDEWAAARRAHGHDVTVVEEFTPGAAAARNRGLAEVTTPWVMFFDSDDVMLPRHVERFVETVKRHPEAEIVGWDVDLVRCNGRRETHRFYSRDIIFHNIFNGNFATLRYAVRSDLFRRVGAWNPSVRGWDDIEVGMRLAVMHPSVVKVSGDATVCVYEQAESITGTDFSSSASRWEYALDRCEETLRSHGHERDAALIDLRRAVLAALYARENSPEAERLLNSLLPKKSGLRRRVLLLTAYHYTRHGGRGIHHILRAFV